MRNLGIHPVHTIRQQHSHTLTQQTFTLTCVFTRKFRGKIAFKKGNLVEIVLANKKR